MNETLKKDLCARLPYEVKIQYEGIVNVKELKEHKKKEPKDIFVSSDEYSEWLFSKPADVIGLKTGTVKEIRFFKNYTYFYIGNRVGYSKLVRNPKPILFPISCLTKEITVNGETFVPMEEMRKELLSHTDWIEATIKNDFDIEGFKKYVPFYHFELLQKWHINYRLEKDQFIEATNEYE